MREDPAAGSVEERPSGPGWSRIPVLLASGASSLLFLMAAVLVLSPLAGTGSASRGTLIAFFLAGGAAGPFLSSRGGTFSRRSLAGLEITKGLWGGWIFWLGPHLSLVLAGIGPPESPGWSSLLRWGLAGALVVPLGLLTGLLLSGLLPVPRSRGQEPNGGQLGVQGGYLLTGGAAGVALGAYLLFPWMGGELGIWIALPLAFLAAAGWWAWGNASPGGAGPGPAPAGMALPSSGGFMAGLSGFVLGAASAVWIRILGLLFGPTWKTSFTSGLVITLGLAIGFLLGESPRTAPGGPGRTFAFHLLAALGLIGGVFLLEPLAGLLPRTFGYPVPAFPLIRISYSAAFLLLVAVGAGAGIDRSAAGALPGCRAALGAGLGGGAAGILLASWLALPAIGGRRTLLLLFLLQILAAGIWAALRPTRRPSRRYGLGAGLGAIALLGVAAAPEWHEGVLTSGIYRYSSAISSGFPSGSEFLDFRRDSRPVYFREGTVGTVALEQGSRPGGEGLFLTVDGNVEGNWNREVFGPALTGHLGLLLRPEAMESPRVALLGLGAGVTASTVLAHRVDSLVILEPERGIVESFSRFAGMAGSLLEDPRVHLRREDLRAWLAFSSAEFDILIGPGPEPWLQRGGPLHTREFFRQCRRHLAPAGFQVHRVLLSGLPPGGFSSILRAFLQAYPEAVALELTAREVLLIGSGKPLRFDIGILQERMSDPPVAGSLLALGIPGRTSVLGRFLAGREDLSLFAGGARPFRDALCPTLDLPRGVSPRGPKELMELLDEAGTKVQPFLGGIGDSEEDGRFLFELAKTFIARGAFLLAEDLAQAISAREEVETGIWLRGQLAYQAGDRGKAISLWEAVLEVNPGHIDSLVSLGGYYQDFGLYNAAETYLEKLAEAHPERLLARYLHGKNLFHLLRDDAAARELEELIRLGGLDRYPIALYYLGEIAKRNARAEEAADYLRRYLERAYEAGRVSLIEANAHLSLAEAYRRIGSGDLAEEHQEAGERLMEQLLGTDPASSRGR